MTFQTPQTYARPERALGFRSTTGAVRFRARHGDTIPVEQLAGLAPSVFAENRHDSRSERYTYIDTRDVLAGLMAEGFVPVGVQQGGSRIEGKRDFTKHVIQLRHRQQFEQAVTARAVGDVFPEISLGNSHDGTSAYVLSLDLFRLVCLNGMTVSDGTVERIKVPHKGNVSDQIIEGAFRVIEQAPKVIDAAAQMAAMSLTHPERLAFARAARELRWEGDTAPISEAMLLAPRRNADSGSDLWRTFNVTQEHLLRGGDRYTLRTTDDQGRERVSQRKTGEVRSIDGSAGLNRALWTLTEEMRRIKAA
jgi:hypothetical protein